MPGSPCRGAEYGRHSNLGWGLPVVSLAQESPFSFARDAGLTKLRVPTSRARPPRQAWFPAPPRPARPNVSKCDPPVCGPHCYAFIQAVECPGTKAARLSPAKLGVCPSMLRSLLRCTFLILIFAELLFGQGVTGGQKSALPAPSSASPSVVTQAGSTSSNDSVFYRSSSRPFSRGNPSLPPW